MSEWLVPTARATAWQPLAAVAACLTVTSVVAAAVGARPVQVLGVAAAALAASVNAGLHDVAAALLSAMPTSAAVRRARRLALLLPAGAMVWLGYMAVGRLIDPGLGWNLGPVAALVMTGLAVAAWAAPAETSVVAGAIVPLLWAAASQLAVGLDNAASDTLLVWQQHPWLVTVAAGTALLVRRER